MSPQQPPLAPFAARPAEPRQGLTGADLIALFAVFFALRALLSLAFPAGGGDTANYRTVALNILQHGCVSLSQPETGLCVPHWGGNQLPGYPAFLAAIWAVFGERGGVALLAQSVLAAGAAVWSGVCAARLAGSRQAGIAVAVAFGLSPLGAPWARFLLTDALSIGATQLVFAELLLALHLGRFRPWLGLALASAVFLRYDNLILAVPIVVVAAVLPERAKMLRSLVVAASIAAVPGATWFARSVTAGLPAVPALDTMPEGAAAPAGYLRWGESWMLSQYEYPEWNYPLVGKRYSGITIPDRAFATEAERATATALLERLRQYDGQPMPVEIDAAFGALADQRARDAPFRQHVALPAARALLMWVDPRYSSGWPVSVPGNSGSLREYALAHPVALLMKAGTAVYRTLLLPLCLAMLLPLVHPPRVVRQVALAAVAYALVQTWAHVAIGLVETRYLLSGTTFLEGALALGIVLVRWRDRP